MPTEKDEKTRGLASDALKSKYPDSKDVGIKNLPEQNEYVVLIDTQSSE